MESTRAVSGDAGPHRPARVGAGKPAHATQTPAQAHRQTTGPDTGSDRPGAARAQHDCGTCDREEASVTGSPRAGSTKKGDMAVKLTKAAAVMAVAPMVLLAAAACGSSGKTATSSAAPASLTVWRMGASTPAQVTWMNGVITQFHKQFPAYAKTAITVKFVPWTVRTTQWQNAISSGKGRPD